LERKVDFRELSADQMFWFLLGFWPVCMDQKARMPPKLASQE